MPRFASKPAILATVCVAADEDETGRIPQRHDCAIDRRRWPLVLRGSGSFATAHAVVTLDRAQMLAIEQSSGVPVRQAELSAWRAPDGGWFLITPVSAGGDRIVLMRQVVTRAGTTTNVTL